MGEGQPFAEVSYKRHTHQVLRWPCHSFPFELSSGKLEIQIYLAEDRAAPGEIMGDLQAEWIEDKGGSGPKNGEIG